MNVVVLMGRLTRDPEIRSTVDGMTVARYSLAVDRPGKDKGADFINCVAFGKTAEFAEKWLSKGTKIAVSGRLQTGSYTDKEGVKRNTVDVIVNQHDFCEKAAAATPKATPEPTDETPEPTDDWMHVPDGVDDDELPFG